MSVLDLNCFDPVNSKFVNSNDSDFYHDKVAYHLRTPNVCLSVALDLKRRVNAFGTFPEVRLSEKFVCIVRFPSSASTLENEVEFVRLSSKMLIAKLIFDICELVMLKVFVGGNRS